MKKFYLALLTFLCSSGYLSQAQAGSNAGTVISIYNSLGGGVSVTMNGSYNVASPPACAAASTTTTFFFDSSTTVGQTYLRNLYASKLAGQSVTIIGTNNCNGSQEQIAAIIF